MTAIERLLEIAGKEVNCPNQPGQDLDGQAKPNGSERYTKYARDLRVFEDPKAWCDLFADWCFVTAFGKERARVLLGDCFTPFITWSVPYYQQQEMFFEQPQTGDLILLQKDGELCHTGIVYDVDADMIYTIEGDTIPEPGISQEGVYKKQHRRSDRDICGYLRPKWGLLPNSAVDMKPYDRLGFFDWSNRYYYSRGPEISAVWREEIIK